MSVVISKSFLDQAKGEWQESVIRYGCQLSTLSLGGKARSYGGKYRTSFNNLVDRCIEQGAFHIEAWGLNGNRRWERFLLVLDHTPTVADLPERYYLINACPDITDDAAWEVPHYFGESVVLGEEYKIPNTVQVPEVVVDLVNERTSQSISVAKDKLMEMGMDLEEAVHTVAVLLWERFYKRGNFAE